MAAWTYDEALRRLLAHEGGYTNHPSDPGGPTNFGITIHDYRRYVKPNATAADVRVMKVDEAKATLVEAGFEADKILRTDVYGTADDVGKVVSMTPVGGVNAQYPKDTVITLSVSTGPDPSLTTTTETPTTTPTTVAPTTTATTAPATTTTTPPATTSTTAP